MKRALVVAMICMTMISTPLMALGLVGFVVSYVKKQVVSSVTGYAQEKALQKMAPGGMPGMMPGMGKMPALSPEAMAAMQKSGFDPSNTTPLTEKEIDALVQRLERMAKQNPQAAGEFDAAQLKQMLASQPQLAPMMRSMSNSLAQAEQSLEQARAAYAKMSPAEKDQVVQQLVAESKKMTPDERAAFVTALQGDFFGLPDDLKVKAAAALQ